MSGCATCGELGERADVDLAAGEALPAAASKLEPIAGGDVRRCPTCGAWFLYKYEYEYNALGPSSEDASLRRIEPDRVKEVLLGSPPSDAVFQALGQLGSSDGEAALMTRLRAELEKPRTSYEAIRKLVGLHLGKSDVAGPDVAAIERLLRHARAEVRKDTLYLLQAHRGSLVFRAAAASTDPNPSVRLAAATAAFGASDEVSLVPAIIACLEDSVDVVRSNAAWALAVFAERNEDVTAALPALEVRLAEESSAKVRTTVERAVDAILAWTPPTRRVHVWRCPKCGSTDAGPDESRSAYEFTFMQCNGCKTGGLVDSWERDSDWSLAIDIPINATDVPAYVAPLAPGDGFYESMQAAKAKPKTKASATATPAPKPAATTPPAPIATPTPPVTGPPTALAVGCERCFGADARIAWEAINASTEASLISDLHFAVDIMACACGQRFAVVFTERVNYREGGDDLTWLALPISSDEHARVARCGKRSVASVLTEIGVDRRFLVRNQTDGPVDAWWRSNGFSIDPTVPSDPAGPAT
ncbi:MAG: HEAT repeat domain-containing protein [Deltaproteobacteria bacterium]|nr:HEAT repeat domain-containing protein [Deltaproteobacteria bacterium]